MDLVPRIETLAASPLTSKELREQVLARLRTVIGFDGHVFALTDPITRVGTSPHADVPMLPWDRLPEVIRWRYLTTTMRVDTMAGRPATSLLTETTDPSESGLWQHVLREVGVVDTACVAFADRYGTWGFLELWRASVPFDANELRVLNAIAPGVTRGIRGSLARTFVDATEHLLPLGPSVVLLGPDLRVRSQTEAAGKALLQLLPPDEPMVPIPAAAYNVGAALMAEEHGVPIGEPWSRVHLGGSRWVTVKASRLGEDIAVSIEPSTPTERADLFARGYGLSDRETEVVHHLTIGSDTRRIAAEMFLSEHTVNDHVKALLAKTGARTRQVLVARVAGA